MTAAVRNPVLTSALPQILGVSEAFKKSSDANKLNLGVGAYRCVRGGQAGRLPVVATVRVLTGHDEGVALAARA